MNILVMAGLTWQPVWESSLLGLPPPWPRHNMVYLPHCPLRPPPLNQDSGTDVITLKWSLWGWMNEQCLDICVVPTIDGWTWFKAEGGAEACAVIKAPALLDLPRACGLGDVLLAGRVADTGARRQRRRLVPNGLGWTGIVHPDPIPEANLTADSEDKIVKHLKVQCLVTGHDRHWGFSQWSQCPCLWP